MTLDLTDEETAALIRELSHSIERDGYPLSPRIRTLRAILNSIPRRGGRNRPHR
jgi:hypothetical protein